MFCKPKCHIGSINSKSYKFAAFYLREVDVTLNTVRTEVAMILLCIVTALYNFLHEASSFAPNHSDFVKFKLYKLHSPYKANVLSS